MAKSTLLRLHEESAPPEEKPPTSLEEDLFYTQYTLLTLMKKDFKNGFI